MTREALLHVGMHKTGTTAIQRAFDGYRDSTWRYLDLGRPNHSLVVGLAFRPDPPMHFREVREGNPEDMRRAARAALTGQLALDRRSVIVSGEDLSFFRFDSVQATVEFFLRHVDRVRVLGYVREPVSYVASSFQEILRRNLPPDDQNARFPPYRNRFARWFRGVGPENLELVLYDRAAFRDGDLLADFAHRVGLSGPCPTPRKAVANVAMSAEHVALLYAIRWRIDRTGATVTPAAFQDLKQGLKGFGSRKFAFTRESLKPGYEANAQHVNWVQKVLGRPFPEPDLSGMACFSSPAALLDHAETLGPLLAERRDRFAIGSARALEADPVGTMVDWMQQRGTAPSGA